MMEQDTEIDIDRSLRVGLNSETRKFFHQTRETFVSSSGTTSELFSKFAKENEEKFLQQCSSHSSITSFKQNGPDFIRSFSTSSDWTMPPLRTERNLQLQFSQTSHPAKLSITDNTLFDNQFPAFVVSNRQMWGASSSGRVSVTHSSYEYCTNMSGMNMSGTNMSRISNEQSTRRITYDMSESESEDEDMLPELMYSPSLNKISTVPTEDSEQLLAIEASPHRDKVFKIATELLTTERTYVAVLHLIDQVFHFRVDQENRAHNMFPQEMIPQMFSNIKSIYQFHHDFVLPQLEARMSNWDKESKIGDIMKKLAPFLKLYTDYVKNLDNATNIINAMASKCPRFNTIMDDIQKMPECGGFPVVHHMVCPVQRIPRYKLLLEAYLKKLPDYSDDKQDTEQALHLVSTAANHVNETMKTTDKFKQLLEVQERISGVVDLVSPTRELLKEGKTVKISARSGDHQDRFLFLFSDLLLLCSARLLSAGISAAYRLRAKFWLEDVQIQEGDNLETANTFYIRDSHKTVELYTQTREEKTFWLDALCNAVERLYKRRSSFKVGKECSISVDLQNPPQYIKMDGVHKCMDCGAGFGVMKRKHHCRACGLVVCGKCSNQKYALPYEDNKLSRVCRSCHQKLVQQKSSSPDKTDSDVEDIRSSFTVARGLLEVAADTQCILSGYLQLKTSKSWVRRWFVLHPDFVLYSYRENNDKHAMTATPIPGYTIEKGKEFRGENVGDAEKIFKMYHTNKVYYFQADTKGIADRWVHVLRTAAKAEIPSPEKKLS